MSLGKVWTPTMILRNNPTLFPFDNSLVWLVFPLGAEVDENKSIQTPSTLVGGSPYGDVTSLTVEEEKTSEEEPGCDVTKRDRIESALMS